MIKSKKFIAYLCAIAMIIPIGLSTQPITTNNAIFAESVEPIELVDGQTPSPAEDFTFDTKTGTITGCNNSSSHVVIPKQIDGVTVKIIGQGAFANSETITKITIPNTVITIQSGGSYDDGAFEGTKTLKEVVFEENSNLINIGYRSFKNCIALNSISIPNNVTNIGGYAFSGCKSLDNVVIPNDVSIIGQNCFQNCTALRKITFNDGLTSIDEYTFSGCTSLDTIVIPGSVTTLGNYCFENCNSLNNITLNSGLTSIGEHAFKNCPGLSEIKFPSSVVSIGIYAFEDCLNLTSVTFSKNAINLSIGNNAFRGCNLSQSVIFSPNMTIGEYAFAETNIKSVKLQNNTSVKTSAFYDCNDLITFETNGIVSLSSSSINSCNTLKSVTISKDTTIGNKALGYDGSSTITDFTINGYTGSSAETYATENSFIFNSIGDISTSVEETINGDVNHDGTVNIIDLIMIKRYILNLIDSLD